MTRAPMTKGEAVSALIAEARRGRNTVKSARQLGKILDVLGVPASERLFIFQHLEYCDGSGMPFLPDLEPLWVTP